MSQFGSVANDYAGLRNGRGARLRALALRRRPSLAIWALERFGVALAAGLMVAAGGAAGLALAGRTLDRDSKAFADATINAMTPAWSQDELIARASPALAAAPPAQFDRLFATLRGLGAGARNQGCDGKATMLSALGNASEVTAAYACAVQAPAGQAIVNLTLARSNDAWAITAIQVRPLAVTAR
jgi:hypothetical protein